MKPLALASACVLALFVSPVHAAAGVIVAGTDSARVLLPPGVDVAPYRNLGYELLRIEEGVARVEVDLSPIRSTAPFHPRLAAEPSPIERLAGAVTWGSRTQHEAAARLLAWVAGNVRYHLDRSESQEASAVLDRRTAFCTGYARLTVALLGAVRIEAREVAGYVAEGRPVAGGAGFHRWIEIHYPDRGWVFSDPLSSHGFVDATYLRISSDKLSVPVPGSGLVIERNDRTVAVDLAPGTSAVSLRLRANNDARVAAALAVELESGLDAEAELVGSGVHRILQLPAGKGTFLGLEPGRYEIRVREAGRLAAWKNITIRDRILAQMSIPRPASSRQESERGR